MKSIQVECDQCGGSGKIELPEVLRETFDLIPKAKSITAVALLENTPQLIGVTALNNRLERLRKKGLVNRHRDGKFWRYCRTNCETDSPKTFTPSKPKKSTR